MRGLIVGCGYVGLPLGSALARQGHEVFGLRRSAAAEHELSAAGIRFIRGDITRPQDLARLPLPFDWVVNCVASGGGGDEAYRRVYLEGTRNLLERFASGSPKKFIYTSSTGVYGQTDGSLVDESSPTAPSSPTARVLLDTERLLLEAARVSGFPAVILRLAGIYGPGRGHWLRQFLHHEARLEGEGGRILNMIHRDDVIGCLVAALQQARPGEVYNAVDDEPISQRHLFEWLAARLGRPLPAAGPAAAPTARSRELTSKRVSNRKLKTELGWQPVFPTFREGFAAELARMKAS